MNLKQSALASALVALIALSPILGGVEAADSPIALKWSQLIPPNAPAPRDPRTFFSGVPSKSDDGQPAPPPLPEGKFMSLKRQQPGAGSPPAVVAELNGKHVEIGGYVVPLDFEATSVKEFLLVPFVGACIHVPPPPANQIIYVKSAKGIEIAGSFDPVKVTGTLKTETAFTGLADAGYSIEADDIEPIAP
jgi:hypothetical protein